LARPDGKDWHIEGATKKHLGDIVTKGMNICGVPYLNLNLHMFSVKDVVYRDCKAAKDSRHFTATCEFIQVVYPKKK